MPIHKEFPLRPHKTYKIPLCGVLHDVWIPFYLSGEPQELVSLS